MAILKAESTRWPEKMPWTRLYDYWKSHNLGDTLMVALKSPSSAWIVTSRWILTMHPYLAHDYMTEEKYRVSRCRRQLP